MKKYYYSTLNTLLDSAIIETYNYSYGDTQWKDKLTSFNGNTITYDAMGNPTSYLGKTLTWEGKRLISYTDGSTSITYAYNEDGLRPSGPARPNTTTTAPC